MDSFLECRSQMVEHQIKARGVQTLATLNAFLDVPREAFLPQSLARFAYDDVLLPIGQNQTISQPFVVALMIEALNLLGGEGVLEIGAGSGYAAAVLSRIAARVYAIERIGQLAKTAACTLSDLHYTNVLVFHGDGTLGCRQYAPYDAIIVAAGAPSIPESLKQQLRVGGRLIIPVGVDLERQKLIRVTRTADDRFTSEVLAVVRFVPLIGKEGWSPPNGKTDALEIVYKG